MKFAIPLKREDLSHAPENDGEYYVKDVFSIRELKTKIKDCEMSVRQSGSDFILSGGFDVLYSVLIHFHKDLAQECKESAFGVIRLAAEKLEKELDKVLGQDGYLTSSEKETWLNKLKMIVYLFCQNMELLESNDSSGSGDLFSKGGRAAKKGKTGSIAWDVDIKLASITILYRLLHMNIVLLFDPPVVGSDFVNVIACCLFRFLENPSIALQRCKDLRMSIIQVLGTLNNRFGYTLSCRLKIVQCLRHFEHIALSLSEAVDVFAREYNCSSIIMEIVRDLCQIDVQELQRDTSATRAYSIFLGDLTERQPEKIKPCLSLLTMHLEGDSPSMRKCVLLILGEIILRVLSGVELDETSKDSRDRYLDCLEDHVHDVHAHVRSSVLQIWGKLCTAKTIPLNRQQKLLELVIGRLQDKSSNVRKQAVQLLTTLLQCNPFMASMSVEDLTSQLKEEQEKLNGMMPSMNLLQKEREMEWEKIKVEVQDTYDEEDEEDQEEAFESATKDEILACLHDLMKERKFGKVQSLMRFAKNNFSGDDLLGENSKEDQLSVLKAIYVASAQAGEEAKDMNDDVGKQRVMVGYYQDAVNFAEELNRVLPTVCLLLGSKQVTDILEAISFFVSAFEFGLLKAMMGVRQMLSLIWSREAVVKDAVMAAYKRLYIDGVDGNAKVRASYIVKNFIALVDGATIGELTSLEELTCMLVEGKDIGKDCFQILWQYFTKCHEGTTDEEARSALVLLGMIANAEPTVITSNLNLLVKIALKEQGMKDFRLVHDACLAISKISNVKGRNDEPPLKFDSDHEIFTNLMTILVMGLQDQTKDFYIPMSQKACAIIYQFSEQPDVFCGKIIKEICEHIIQNPSPMLMKRLISLVGNIAVCQLNFLDVTVMGELKRRKFLRDQKKEKSKNGRKSLGKRRQSKTTLGAGDDDEMDMIGAEADDTEIEFIRNVCESEILSSENLLATFVPLVIHICLHPAKFQDSQLCAAASLVLAKLMLISSKFCEENLQILFTMMEKSNDPIIRANLIIASGDLSFRFPNTLEPWTPHMYGRLRDTSTLVRSNTLTVLTHLILNDMIKVKGQISDIALCISDDNAKISGLSKHFFSELARKGNALYNVMPDIISRLSSAESQVPEEQFQFIMSYIVSLIEKDKHLESLVEKLCHRFRVTHSERQWRDLSFCLSLFTFSDKAIKKLHDNFSCYSDKLHDEDVFNAFTGILVQARKQAKNETKTSIDELEDLLGKAHEKCLDDFKTSSRAKGAKKGAHKGKAIVENDIEVAEADEEEGREQDPSPVSDVSMDLENKSPTPSPPKRTTRKRRK